MWRVLTRTKKEKQCVQDSLWLLFNFTPFHFQGAYFKISVTHVMHGNVLWATRVQQKLHLRSWKSLRKYEQIWLCTSQLWEARHVDLFTLECLDVKWSFRLLSVHCKATYVDMSVFIFSCKRSLAFCKPARWEKTQTKLQTAHRPCFEERSRENISFWWRISRSKYSPIS